MQVYNPATGELIGDVPYMGIVETKAAINSASEALLSKFLRGFLYKAILMKEIAHKSDSLLAILMGR